MNIGIDIDGVIIDSITLVSSHLSKHYKRDINSYDVAHGLCKLEGLDSFFRNYGESLFGTLATIDGSVAAINNLSLKHDIYLISARYQYHYDQTINWIKKYNFNVAGVIFTEGKSKTEICLNTKIDLLIEDSVINAQEIADIGTRVILLETDYNKNFSHENVSYCKDWNQILKLIRSN